MSRCDVTAVLGSRGEIKRVMVNGQPVPGLLRASISGSPRDRSTLSLTIMPSSLETTQEPSE